MTLPTDNIYPIVTEFEDMEDARQYLLNLVFNLETRDEQIADEINGLIQGSSLVQQENWTPVLMGTTAAGTFTYTNQIGWSFRQGLLTDVWFDILWTAQSGATGNLFIELPYQVASSNGKPFVGPLQTETLSYGAGQTVLNINAIPSTYRGEIWSSGSGNATANIAVASSGHLIGYVRYIGVRDE